MQLDFIFQEPILRTSLDTGAAVAIQTREDNAPDSCLSDFIDLHTGDMK